MTDHEPEPISPHREVATRLLDGRSTAGSPAVSPDGERIAFVVATIDLAQNTTSTRIWLAGRGDPAPITAGPRDRDPQWSPDGRWLAFASSRGEKDHETTIHVLPVDGPGEVRTVATMPDGGDDLRWSPDGRCLAFTSRARDARYEAEDERWQSPRKIERFFSRLDNEGWVVDRPNHVFVVAADGTGKPRDLTPGPFQHGGIAWLADSSGLVTAAERHETWDRDLCEDLYVVPLDGTIRALTKQTGVYHQPAVSPDGTRVAFFGADDPSTYPQNMRVGVVSVDGGEHHWISTGLDRTFETTAGSRAPLWLDDDTLLATAEDRGETHLFRLAADGSTAPEPLTSGPSTIHAFDAAGGRIAMARSTVAHPAEIVTLDGPVTRVTESFLGWERFAVPTADGTDEIDAWIMRPAGFESRRRYPVLLNVHGGP
ncbi:MAG: S9 family peptidase, partial [Ilumatobacteraceae bacterium]